MKLQLTIDPIQTDVSCTDINRWFEHQKHCDLDVSYQHTGENSISVLINDDGLDKAGFIAVVRELMDMLEQ